jgi:hypothetical protein
VLDLRPPLDPLFYAFGPASGPFEITVPGRPPELRDCAWLPSRAEFESVGNEAVLDTMPTLAIRLVPTDHGRLPVGTRAVGPALGETDPRVWTVRKVFASPAPDAEIVVAGVADNGPAPVPP